LPNSDNTTRGALAATDGNSSTLLSYKTVIATICPASAIMANAAEPQIVKDAVEAAEWMAKALSSSGGLLSDHLGARFRAWPTLVRSFAGKAKATGGDDNDPKGAINLAI
jgi:hypothetical protein